MARKKRSARSPAPKHNGRPRAPSLLDIWTHNTLEAARVESYTITTRIVEELLKDPKLRRRLEYHSAQIIKAIAEAIPDMPEPD